MARRASSKSPSGVGDAFADWRRTFEADARADKYRVVRDALAAFDQLNNRKYAVANVTATVQRVAMSLAYMSIDGHDDAAAFLRQQTYDPAKSSARYRYWFEPWGGWILVTEKGDMDLADLFNSPPGFYGIRVDHTDGSDFDPGEHDRIVKEIEDDIYFDFSREEIDLDVREHPWGLEVYFDEEQEWDEDEPDGGAEAGPPPG